MLLNQGESFLFALRLSNMRLTFIYQEKIMPCDYQNLPHAGIQTLSPYVPGKSIDELAREQGIKNIIKLASNENPLGCSPLAHRALTKLSSQTISLYPTPAIHPLKHKLSEHLAVDEAMITLGNGSDSLFRLLLTAFALHTNKHVVTHDKAFITFNIQAQALGIPIKSTPLLANWHIDTQALINACNQDTAIVFIANPNNPTGALLSVEQLRTILVAIPASTIMLLDEAYYEYAYALHDNATIALLADFPNLVITRTFSKIYGLAGLRLGYAISEAGISELLQRIQLPFAVNQAALAAGFAALDDQAFLTETLDLNAQGLKALRQGLDALNVAYLPSSCNYITLDCGMSSLPIYNGLLREGIIVRPLLPYNMPNHLRVSTGKLHHNQRFLEKFAICLHKNLQDSSTS